MPQSPHQHQDAIAIVHSSLPLRLFHFLLLLLLLLLLQELLQLLLHVRVLMLVQELQRIGAPRQEEKFRLARVIAWRL